MRVHVIQHVPFEGPGAILHWAAEHSYRVTNTKVFTGEPFPGTDEVDLLVIMGGPMSVNDDDDLPWLAEEKRVVGRFIREGKRVIGICLGAQLIANVLGQRVYQAAEKEIGWFPVSLTADAKATALFQDFPPNFVPFHWHGETFDLPPEALLIASSAAVRNQAFVVGEKIVGIQFHLESTAETIAELLEYAASDITGGAWQQSPAQVAADAVERLAASRRLLYLLLDRLAVS